MSRIDFAQVQKNVSEIANRSQYSRDFIFELMAAYGRSLTSITKLKDGSINLSEDKENDILQRGVIYFCQINKGNVTSIASDMSNDPSTIRYNPRYVIVTDFDELAAIDTKKNTNLGLMKVLGCFSNQYLVN